MRQNTAHSFATDRICLRPALLLALALPGAVGDRGFEADAAECPRSGAGGRIDGRAAGPRRLAVTLAAAGLRPPQDGSAEDPSLEGPAEIPAEPEPQPQPVGLLDTAMRASGGRARVVADESWICKPVGGWLAWLNEPWGGRGRGRGGATDSTGLAAADDEERKEAAAGPRGVGLLSFPGTLMRFILGVLHRELLVDGLDDGPGDSARATKALPAGGGGQQLPCDLGRPDIRVHIPGP